MSELQLDELSERLIIRSQEAILQLDLWIQNQRLNSIQLISDECRNTTSTNESVAKYEVFMAQLNSLYVRSEHLRNKVGSGPICNQFEDTRCIENLIYEFQNITNQLNELASSEKKPISTLPDSSRTSSMESVTLKPIKIVERQRIKRESLKKIPATSVQFDLPETTKTHVDNLSLPGSPIKKSMEIKRSPEKSIRNFKSYDTGLNKRKKKKSKMESSYDELFKNNQRLSISLFNDTDVLEEGRTITSDQETIVSSSSVIPYDDQFDNLTKSQHQPLRRFNSHESILSFRHQPHLTQPPRQPNFFKFSAPSLATATAIAKPSGPKSYQTSGNQTTSRDLLSLYTNTKTHEDQQKAKKPSSFWDFLGFSSSTSSSLLVSSEVALPTKDLSSTQRQDLVRPQRNNQWKNNTYENHSTLRIGHNGSRYITSPESSHDPIFRNLVSYEELHNALNTELRLAI